MIHHQMSCATKKFQGNFFLLTAPQTSQKNMCLNICFRNGEKLIIFLYNKKIFSKKLEVLV